VICSSQPYTCPPAQLCCIRPCLSWRDQFNGTAMTNARCSRQYTLSHTHTHSPSRLHMTPWRDTLFAKQLVWRCHGPAVMGSPHSRRPRKKEPRRPRSTQRNHATHAHTHTHSWLALHRSTQGTNMHTHTPCTEGTAHPASQQRTCLIPTGPSLHTRPQRLHTLHQGPCGPPNNLLRTFPGEHPTQRPSQPASQPAPEPSRIRNGLYGEAGLSEDPKLLTTSRRYL
jgi:hypothetical protein